jgi:hypothetical protein
METYLSIHIPKTAGTLFGRALAGIVPELIYYYYGPTTPPSRFLEKGRPTNAHENQKLKEVFLQKAVSQTAGIAIVHGHYKPTEFLDHIPEARSLVWFREPAQRLRSHFEFWKKPPRKPNAKYELFQKSGFSFIEFATHPEFTDLQSKYIEGLSLKDFLFVGVVEEMEASYSRLERIFPNLTKPEIGEKINHNQDKHSPLYAFSSEELGRIRDANPLDYEIYEQALAQVAL